jgi:hypothetical protein
MLSHVHTRIHTFIQKHTNTLVYATFMQISLSLSFFSFGFLSLARSLPPIISFTYKHTDETANSFCDSGLTLEINSTER